MNKNLRHMASIHNAAQELHKRFAGVTWFIGCQVFSLPIERGATINKQERKEIVVYVRDLEAVKDSITTYNSWPIRYELGV